MSDVVLSPLRMGRITGSRIGPILGLSNPSYDNGTKAKVLREMFRQYHGLTPTFSGNEATDYGHEHEPDMVAAYEKQELQIVHAHGADQQFVIHPFYDFLAVTPDGLVGTKGAIEGKCPFRARYIHVSERADYEVQCRLVMECTGREWCDFVVWRPRSLHVSRVLYDPAWLPSVLPRLQAFMDEYQVAIHDEELLAAELGRGTSKELSQREKFLAAQARWKELAAQEAAIGAELAQVKETVGELLGDNEIGTLDGKPVAKWQYRNGPSVFDRQSFKKAHADLEAQFSTTGKASKFPILIDEQEGEVA